MTCKRLSAEGNGNFSTSNTAHMDFWDKVFDDMNGRLANVYPEACSDCTDHYPNLHLEFVPNYIDVKDNLAWDHTNDPQITTYNSGNKWYLNCIDALAAQSSDWEDG